MNWGSFHYIYIMEIANITHNNSSSNGSSISRQNLYTYEVILNWYDFYNQYVYLNDKF